MEGKWEFPGGKTEKNETLKEVLMRKFKEKSNVNIEVEGFFCESIYEYEFGAIRLSAYKCKCDDKDFKLSVHSKN